MIQAAAASFGATILQRREPVWSPMQPKARSFSEIETSVRTAFQRSTKEGPFHEQRTRGMDDLFKTVSLEGVLGLRVEHTPTTLHHNFTQTLPPLSLRGELRIFFFLLRRSSIPWGTRTLRLCVSRICWLPLLKEHLLQRLQRASEGT